MIRYKIVLNYGGEIKTYYVHAYSEVQALLLAIRKLETELNLERGALRNYFFNHKLNKDAYKV